MGQFYDSIPPNLLEWIKKQHLFWVASAPLDANGHVNVSPKGTYDCFHVIGPNKVWYEDLSGSGVETISHMRENGRMTIMFNAFDGPPRIVRLFGKGTIHEYGTPEYEELIPEQRRKPGSRAAIVLDIHKVGSSCGYTVPYYDFKGDRTMLLEHMSKLEESDQVFEATHSDDANVKLKNLDTTNPTPERAEKGLRAYWLKKNMTSIDGLPGLSNGPYARPTPQSTWKLLGKSEIEKYENDGETGNKTLAIRVLQMMPVVSQEVKLITAFSLGMLVALVSLRLSTRFSYFMF